MGAVGCLSIPEHQGFHLAYKVSEGTIDTWEEEDNGNLVSSLLPGEYGIPKHLFNSG